MRVVVDHQHQIPLIDLRLRVGKVGFVFRIGLPGMEPRVRRQPDDELVPSPGTL